MYLYYSVEVVAVVSPLQLISCWLRCSRRHRELIGCKISEKYGLICVVMETVLIMTSFVQYWQVSTVVLKVLGTACTEQNKDSSRIVRTIQLY